MQKGEFFNRLVSLFPHQLTDDQSALFQIFTEFCFSDAHMPVLIINGYAGTGKTTALAVMAEAMEMSGIPTVLLASTGRAAKVLSGFCAKNAYTIHKKIYRQKSVRDGKSSFVLNANLGKAKVFIVDEASMISMQTQESQLFGSGNLLEDLVEFVFSNDNCRLILSGDVAQLPPVGESQSPALNPTVLKNMGCTVFPVRLSQITRQSEDSGILMNATRVRNILETSLRAALVFDVKGYPDIVSVAGEDLQAAIETSYHTYGSDETIIVCRSNKQANRYNQFIRNRILFREEALTPGDKLLVVKNNYFWLPENENTDFIANGDFLILKKIRRTESMHGFRFADCVLEFPDFPLEFDAKILLESLESDGPGITREQANQLYNAVAEDYAHIGDKRKRYEKMLEDPYFNALQTKMGYAMTCHKAQGGQWKSVFVDFAFSDEESREAEVQRWLYTALTRATEKLMLVNFAGHYFER